MRLNRSEVGLETFPALFSELSNLRDMLDNPLFGGCTTRTGFRLDQPKCGLCLNLQLYPSPLPSSISVMSQCRGEKESRKTKWEAERMENKGDTDRKKEERKGEGKALFRQPDNLPSPEHIYGCPLTPSCCSLWRKSQCCWPACRFPIISLAEGSCLPIHQQVWTCRLWWSSISCYNTTTQLWPQQKKNKMMHWSYLHVNSEIHPPGRVVVSTALRTDIHMYNCTATLWEQWPYINSNTWA